MRYVEGWGSGLRRVNRILAEYGIRPVAIDEAAFATRMNVYRASAKVYVNEDNREDNEDSHAGREGGTDADALILAKLRSNGRISVRQLASELPISKATVERALHKLQVAGRIRRKGRTRGVWEVI